MRPSPSSVRHSSTTCCSPRCCRCCRHGPTARRRSRASSSPPRSRASSPIRRARWSTWACSRPTGTSSSRAGQPCWNATTSSSPARRRQMNSADVRLQNLSKQYHRTTAVDDVSLTIEPGSMVALLGPSGCGKTTCLRMIAGLVSPTSGDILVNGGRVTRVPVHRRNIGMLFQNYALFPHMTVRENIAFGLEMRGIGKADAARRVSHALDLVRLADFGGRLPSQLSGGQKQRVALARALVIEPAVLLLDEPLGALDKGLRESMQVELRALQRRLGVTTVMVTHDQDEALTMADRIVVMREGRLEQVGTATDIYQRPASRFVATFLGASNLFDGKVERGSGGEALVTTAGGLSLLVDGVAPDARDV